HRVAGSRRGSEKVAAGIIQPSGILEVRELNLPTLLRFCLAGKRVADRSIGSDAHGLCFFRNRDGWFDRVAVERHQVPVAVQMQGAVSCIRELARRRAYLKKAAALNHKIQRVARLRERSLREHYLVR